MRELTRTRSPGLDTDLILRAAASLVLVLSVLWAAWVDGPLSTRAGASWVPDAPNYYAAGERLNAGHSLYALGPKDRPVVLDSWVPAPLLSPPLIAVVWRPLALFPLDVAVVAWAMFGFLVLIGGSLWLIWKGGRGVSIGVLLLCVPLGLTAWSGNVQSLLTPGLCCVWPWSRANRTGRSGAVVGLGTVAKLAAAPLFAWFIVTRQTRSVRAAVAFASLGLVLGLLGAGLDSHLDYVHVASEVGSAGGTALSAGGLAGLLGVPPALRGLAAPVVLLLGVGAIGATRRRADVAFAIAILVGVAGLTVVNLTNVTMLLAAFVPFGASRRSAEAGGRRASSATRGGD